MSKAALLRRSCAVSPGLSSFFRARPLPDGSGSLPAVGYWPCLATYPCPAAPYLPQGSLPTVPGLRLPRVGQMLAAGADFTALHCHVVLVRSVV